MPAYVDSSALLKRYLDEPDSDAAQGLLDDAGGIFTSRVAVVEVRRGISRIENPVERGMAKTLFMQDLSLMFVIEADAQVCELAAQFAERTALRSLDAIHVASAQRALGTTANFVTFDSRQAAGARELGLTVKGA
ncbi:MAG: type II toxin-antitoxin system VapC family toxin [Actinomycetes bacterium]